MSPAAAIRFPAREPPAITPMPEKNARGPGRDPAFSLPQFYIDVNGLRTAFADQGTGPAVLFIHGLAGNVAHWVNVAPAFVGAHRVLAIDLPGHGETDRTPGRYSMDGYVDHVVAFLDLLGVPDVTVVGHSMGGMVSLALAIRHPSRVRGAVLVNPAGMARLPAWARYGGRLVLRRRLLDKLLPKVWKNGILSNVFYEKNDYTRAFIAMIESSFDLPGADQQLLDVAILMDELKGELLERDYAHFLGSIDRPIGVVWGAKDRLVPARLLHDAARQLPNVLLDEIPRCGHMPNIEQPERVTRFIQIVLDRSASDRSPADRSPADRSPSDRSPSDRSPSDRSAKATPFAVR